MTDPMLTELQRLVDEMKTHEQIAKVAAKHGAPHAPSGPKMTGGVHISISVSPTAGGGLEKDVQYVKAALLYADRVTLSSPSAAMLTSIMGVAKLRPRERIEFMRDVIPIMNTTSDSAQIVKFLGDISRAMKKRRPWEPENEVVSQFKPVLEECWKQVTAGMMELGHRFGIFELAAPLESGVLDIVPLESWNDTDRVVQTYFNRLVRDCGDPATIPLIDESSADLLGAALREGIVTIQREQTPCRSMEFLPRAYLIVSRLSLS